MGSVGASWFCKDALSTNRCIAALEQQHIRSNAGVLGESQSVLLELECCHHQAALAKRPIVLSVEGVATTLVRMSHLLQSSAFGNKVADSLQALMKPPYLTVVKVLAMPPEAAEWYSVTQTSPITILVFESALQLKIVARVASGPNMTYHSMAVLPVSLDAKHV
jgi:hypothetical protein